MKKTVGLLIIVFIYIGLVFPVAAASSSSSLAPSETPIPSPTIAPTAILTPVPTSVTLDKGPILGVNCGNAYADSASGANKCCVNPDNDPQLPFGAPLNTAVGLANRLINPIVDPYKAIAPTMQPCAVGDPVPPGDLTNPSCICVVPTGVSLEGIEKLCDNIEDSDEVTHCRDCLHSGGVWTSVSCIHPNTQSFIAEIFWRWGVGLAGGISLLCIMYSAIMMQTSGGNAEKIKKAQQLMTSCITGLIIIIFSVLILRIIGVNILRIPGFE